MHKDPESFKLVLREERDIFFKPYFYFDETEGKAFDRKRKQIMRASRKISATIYHHILKKRFGIPWAPFWLFALAQKARSQNNGFTAFLLNIMRLVNSRQQKTYIHPYLYKYGLLGHPEREGCKS